MAKESPFGLFEKIMSPLHNISMAVTAAAALSLHTLLTQLFEPAKKLYYSFLLTFPLTAGLLIVLLVAYNTNWKKISLIHIILSVMPVALLFMLLNLISEKYGLQQKGEFEEKENNKTVAIVKKDSPVLAAAKYDSPGTVPYGMNGINKMLEERRKADAAEAYHAAHKAWYEYQPVKNFLGALLFLKEQFTSMYINYGPGRFISGIVLALLLSLYIQKNGINRIMKERGGET